MLLQRAGSVQTPPAGAAPRAERVAAGIPPELYTDVPVLPSSLRVDSAV